MPINSFTAPSRNFSVQLNRRISVSDQKQRRRNIAMRQAGAYSGVMYWKTGPHSLPLARIKKIMKKSGEDVKMISGEAPIVFSKACELFIEELTKRSWMIAMQSKKRMLHKEDVASAILATDVFDFLIGLIFHETGTGGDLAESETVSMPVEMRFLQS